MNRIVLGSSSDGQTSTLEWFPCGNGKDVHGCVLILPGGEYRFTADYEKAPVAERFNQLGFHAAVCTYRCKPLRYPVPLQDVQSALRYLRINAETLKLQADQIAVLGFSAGGHLAAMAAHCANEEAVRVNALILGYPVLSFTAGGDRVHRQSFYNLLGEHAGDAEYMKFSWPEQVTGDTPPTFLWHTAADNYVPVENSIEYALALKKHNVPFALHIYPDGGHGLAIGNAPGWEHKFPELESWPELCGIWLKHLGWQ